MQSKCRGLQRLWDGFPVNIFCTIETLMLLFEVFSKTSLFSHMFKNKNKGTPLI